LFKREKYRQLSYAMIQFGMSLEIENRNGKKFSEENCGEQNKRQEFVLVCRDRFGNWRVYTIPYAARVEKRWKFGVLKPVFHRVFCDDWRAGFSRLPSSPDAAAWRR
jgi:hypothetical protein